MDRGPRPKLDCVDALRGLAVLLVILFHLGVGDHPGAYHPAVAAALWPFRYGYSGVHLFLVLSGFCLTSSLLRRRRAGRAQGFGPYLAARWWRIAPPYYAAMAVYLAFPVSYLLVGHVGVASRWLTFRQVASHLAFAHGLWRDTIFEINVPFWSLSLEFQFYLTLPLLFLLARRYGPWPPVAAVAALSATYRALLARLAPGQDHLVIGLFLGRWTEFALGMAVAFWFDRPDRVAVGGRRPRATPALAGLVLLAGAIGLSEAAGPSWAVDVLFGGGYAALLAAALRAAEAGGRAASVAEFAPLVRAGAISYSLYLTHNLFLERSVQVYRRLVPHPGPATDAALVAVALALATLGGWAFYRLVESRFVRSVESPRRPAAGPEQAVGAALPATAPA